VQAASASVILSFTDRLVAGLTRIERNPLHSAAYRSITRLLLASTLLGAATFSAVSLHAQNSAAANTSSPAQLALTDSLTAIQPLLSQVNLAVSSVDVRHWKAPGDTRDTTTADVQSIQKDLNQTLPGLIDRAVNSPGAISPAFAVYRNIDALYDVLLRITETATLAGTTSEADRLEQVRAQLQARRSQLGNAILNSSAAQDNDIVQLRTARAAAPVVSPSATAPKKIVVNDGPDSSAKPVRKKKPAANPTANPQ
jgi:hypothetical protein